MRDFFNAYKGELYKSTRKQTVLKLCIAIVILIVVITLFFTVMDSILSSLGISTEPMPTFASNEQAIEVLTETISDYEAKLARGEVSNSIVNNQLNQYKAMLAKYEYLLANNLNESDFIDYGTFSGTNGISYVVQILQILTEAIIIFAIIMCVKNYVSEIHSGTMKMQLIRPVSREKTFTAKYMSIFTISVAALFIFTIVSEIIGIAKFGAESKQIIAVVDSSHVLVMSPFAYIVLEFVGAMVKIFAACQLTYFVSNIFRGRNAAIAVPILIVVLGSTLEKFLAYGYIGYVGFVSNFNFLTAMSINGAAFKGMTMWSMLLICAAWLAGMMTFNYLSFKKRDIN